MSSTSLGSLVSPLMSTANGVMTALTSIQSQIKQSDPALQNAVKALLQNDSAAVDFSGLGAQAFQEAVTVHVDVTEYFTTAFQGAYSALSALFTEVGQNNQQYDGQLMTIQDTNYAPYPSDNVSQGAHEAFLNLNPYAAMITNVLANASGNAVLQSGSASLLGLLNGAYGQLITRAEQETIAIPFETKPTPADQARAQQMVLGSIESLYIDVSQVYTSWGDAVEQHFSTFQSAMHTVEQQLQPAVDILTNPNSAVSVFDLIHMISGSNQPIAITRTGPNSIIVMISGTELNNLSYDTNVYNALAAGMEQSNQPYMQDVIDAIQTYCAEHGLTNPQVTLAGHSLGGMVAQEVAGTGLFNVTQVVTYGSPTMENPVPGVQYDIYAAQWDPVATLSRYEDPALPSSLQQVAGMFPYFPTNYEGYHGYTSPFSWSGLTHDLGSTVHNIAATGHDVGTALADVGSVSHGLSSAGPVLALAGISYGNMITPASKQAFMDPYGYYGNSIKIVPDLTTLNPGVHSDYGQSTWLEQQKIFQNMPRSGFLSNTEYFGMPNTPATAQIDQYMQTHSSLGQILSHFVKMNP